MFSRVGSGLLSWSVWWESWAHHLPSMSAQDLACCPASQEAPDMSWSSTSQLSERLMRSPSQQFPTGGCLFWGQQKPLCFEYPW